MKKSRAAFLMKPLFWMQYVIIKLKIVGFFSGSAVCHFCWFPYYCWFLWEYWNYRKQAIWINRSVRLLSLKGLTYHRLCDSSWYYTLHFSALGLSFSFFSQSEWVIPSMHLSSSTVGNQVYHPFSDQDVFKAQPSRILHFSLKTSVSVQTPSSLSLYLYFLV